MPPPKFLCTKCGVERAAVKRPRNGQLLCRECFFALFEAEIHDTIQSERLFVPGDVVACGASGGKDSTVLIHLLDTLNKQHRYGIHIELVSVDEGIVGYRDDSLETVKRNSACYGLPLHILSYRDIFGWTMDDIVRVVGLRNNCTFCGVFRRQALEKGAALVKADKIATGHNADDMAETILMNVLRADAPRLSRCTSAVAAGEGILPRVKPLKYAYEKEIVLYAHFKKLDYFTTECTYAKEAFRGAARTLMKDLEALRPRSIADTVYSGEHLEVQAPEAVPASLPKPCEKCSYLTSQRLCRACVLLESLARGDPSAALRRTMV
ncbi:putative PP-loop family/Zinc-ribbon [Leishmania naiffi]|uniref:Cytoplasmic tRNA 2-thiolation protein 1 n=1 Tax=Leishmania naiffi TaxID=5678 RepID=A0AAW3B5H6_9TRYP